MRMIQKPRAISQRKVLSIFTASALVSILLTSSVEAAPSSGCVKVSKSKVVCKPAAPSLKVVADYWGYSVYISLPKSSAKADSYLYSTNSGKKWESVSVPYVYVPIANTANVVVQVKARNVAGLSLAKSASARTKLNDTCAQKKDCKTLPLPTAFIKVQSVLNLVVGSSLTLPIHSNVDPQFDTTGGCEIDEKTLKLTTSEVGPCEVYAFGYGDGVFSQGFAHSNLIVFVTKAGSPSVSNAIKANDFACSKPAKIVGSAPGAPFAQVMAKGKTAVSVHLGFPTNRGSSPVSCFDYSLDNGKTWKYASDSSGPLTFYVKGLKRGTKYAIKVRAMNKGGYGLTSDSLGVVTSS